MQFVYTKLTIFSRSFFVLLCCVFTGNGLLKAQNCSEFQNFDGSEKGFIHWSQFPEFSLPFDIIYGLPFKNGEYTQPLTHGFSHIADPSNLSNVPADRRTQIYYGSAYANSGEPWEQIRSPWENDMNVYQNKWQQDFNSLAAQAGNSSQLDSDIFSFDIERLWRFDHEILQLKSSASIPAEYKGLSDSDFLKRYKTDMRTLYALSVKSILDKGKAAQTRVGSYADTPIVNTFDNIQGRSWEQWKTDKTALNFLCTDENGNVGGPFYDQLNIATPSAYYYYDYPHPFAGEYLSYLLFQIEANRAWTNKPIIPFVWMRYSFNENVVNSYIKPWMAEATAIFPFFSGAKGLWLWENPILFQSESAYSIYSHFIKGLFRLSQVKRFFEGNYELVMQTSARDYNESHAPIWRAVVKENEILIAAHNPFAGNENEEVTVGLAYNNWSGSVTLKGYETKLCVFDMSVLGIETEDNSGFLIYPNPNEGRVKLRFRALEAGRAEVKLLTLNGRVLESGSYEVREGENIIEKDLSELNETHLIVQLVVDGKKFVQKIAQH